MHLLNLSCPLIDPTSDPPHPRGLLQKKVLLSYSNPPLYLQGISLNVLPIEALTDELMEAGAPAANPWRHRQVSQDTAKL